jgi:hypothetical protein
MSHDEAAHAINDALSGLPLDDRLVALACSIILDDPRALSAVANLISFAGIMARQLSPPQRLAIVWHLLEEIKRINAKWN